MVFLLIIILNVYIISTITLFYVVHGSEHKWLFNALKLFYYKSAFIKNGRHNKKNCMKRKKCMNIEKNMSALYSKCLEVLASPLPRQRVLWLEVLVGAG